MSGARQISPEFQPVEVELSTFMHSVPAFVVVNVGSWNGVPLGFWNPAMKRVPAIIGVKEDSVITNVVLNKIIFFLIIVLS